MFNGVSLEDLTITRVLSMKPEMYFTAEEEDYALALKKQLTSEGKRKLVMFQWIGGLVPSQQTLEAFNDALDRMHKRSLKKEIAQDITLKLVSKGYSVVDVSLDVYPSLERALRLKVNLRQIIALLKYTDIFIGIDSFLQHASAIRGREKRGIVLWGGTNPKLLGYKHNINLTRKVCDTPFCHRPNTFLFDISVNGRLWTCPYKNKCMDYSTDEVVNNIDV